MAAITQQSLSLNVQREKEHKAFAMVVIARQMQNVVAINENGF